MLGAVVRAAGASNQRRMIVTDSPSSAQTWSNQLVGKGLNIGWDQLTDSFEFLSIAESNKLTDKQYDHLLLDLRGSFSPADIVRSIAVIRAGGVIIVVTPSFESWVSPKSDTLKSIGSRQLFVQRMIKKFYEHEGIWIHRHGKWEKESNESLFELNQKMPRSDSLNQALELAKQLKGVIVLKGKPGTGKSASAGLMLAMAKSKKSSKLNAIVTGQSFESAKTVFNFVLKGLKNSGISVQIRQNTVFGKKFKLRFYEPLDSLQKKPDILIIDEPTGISPELLKQLIKRQPTIVCWSTQISDSNELPIPADSTVIEMNNSILYSQNDPIEAWLFDTLLMDVACEQSVSKNAAIEFPEPQQLFRDEDLLRKFFGFFLTGPEVQINDIMTIMDAPHHFPGLAFSAGQLIGALQLAQEGGLSQNQAIKLFENKRPQGHLVPDILAKHYGLLDFPCLKGVRLVRTAADILLLDMTALEQLADDWLGVCSFSSVSDARALIKKGFQPVHVSPYRNQMTGRYSVVFVKPLSDQAIIFIGQAHESFKKRLIDSLSDNLSEMLPELALEFLKSSQIDSELDFSEQDAKRMEMYVQGRHIYELDFDLILRMVKHYFFLADSFLDKQDEMVLIAKVLQRKDWRKVEQEIGKKKVYDSVRSAVSAIWSEQGL
ncbi:MAG: tRNA(Met) cytidine acetyltransferase [Candidatus Altiarchaeota archaeon]|nr:tRNA(Met) cytidine acetyltransferase [Candidatus Altiarchaeota archaeon]